MEDRVFELDPRINRKRVRFRNRFGIELAGDLYLPESAAVGKWPAIIVAGPFGAVKEQAAGLYAQQLAVCGFVSLAFDPSFCGESGGAVRHMASPDIFTEDYSAAVDFIGLLDFVDRQRIGAVGICGLAGMALTAAGTDTRIKAVAALSMYDMSRDMSRGYRDCYTEEQRNKIKKHLSEQRWRDAESGTFAPGSHEISFDEHNEPITGPMEIPDELPEGADPVTAAFFRYYAKRARHPRAVNFVSSWAATMPVSFFSFPLMTNIREISPRPLLLIAGEKAHSRYYSEDAYTAAAEPKELMIVPDADHVDLYDNRDKIPFDRLALFFREHLK
ncbi:MAG: alpha/beta hydrolase [Clostridiales bacterium]|nr:alpha/beta hydrolase [Clostridiales bacterium]